MLLGMDVVAYVLVGLVAALHLYFLVLEMFLWDKPLGRKTLRQHRGVRRGQQGARRQPGPLQRLPGRGLVWGLVAQRYDVCVFFLACVIVAGRLRRDHGQPCGSCVRRRRCRRYSRSAPSAGSPG